MSQAEPNPAQHAQALYNLSAQIAALLGEALRRDFTFSGTALGQSEVVDQALDGQMQYGLLACALDKIEINEATAPGYWAKLHQELKRLVAREAHASAVEILRPLAAVVSDQEMAAISEAIYNPWAPMRKAAWPVCRRAWPARLSRCWPRGWSRASSPRVRTPRPSPTG